MHNFRQLNIWKEAILIAKKVHAIAKSLPVEERYGLTNQLNRAAISVPSNIAEGSSRLSNKDFGHFLSIALGSLFEIETQLILAFEFGYITSQTLHETSEEIILLQKMITNFKKTLSMS